jgi:amino acid transporter
MAGWVYLACSAVSLASVALALQATLPRISPVFQVVGDVANANDAARNAVVLGCVLIAFSTVINALGVRLLARINNVGVFAEMAGAVLLIGMLATNAVRSPVVVFSKDGRGAGLAWGYLGPFLAAALTPCFVMYGFDTAGSLAEETTDPRRRAPRAILGALASVGVMGALLILVTLCSVREIGDPVLARSTGGMPYAIRSVLGGRVGLVLLCDIVIAITVCTLTVHAAAVRLMFSMARDSDLPFAHALARIPDASRTPILPAVILGVAALGFLVLNADFPQVIEVMASVAVVWANLAYLFVTGSLLWRRIRGSAPKTAGVFSLGRFGFAVNVLAVLWGVLVVVNIGWPRPEVYGQSWYRRHSAVLATAAMLGVGACASRIVLRQRRGVLAEHRAAVDGFESMAVERFQTEGVG